MQTYRVRVTRVSDAHAQAAVRTFFLELGAHRADDDAGFNSVETLLASLGSCLLTSLNFVAELSHVPIEGAWIELDATRQDRPPIIVAIRYRLHVSSTQPSERVERMVELARANSTVLGTLARATAVQGDWIRD